MQKKGQLRALRNIPVGWVSHANHARDLTERVAHHLAELAAIAVAVGLVFALCPRQSAPYFVLATLLAIHTVWWVINGNCHVCLLDSFHVVRNAGVDAVLCYVQWVRDLFVRHDCVAAILVYGSFCRCEFHGRSDLDLRLIRKKGWKASVTALTLAILARCVSLRRGIPTDLQIVDSEEYLLRQMRADELPVSVFGGGGLKKIRVGMSFDEVMRHPQLILKSGSGIRDTSGV